MTHRAIFDLLPPEERPIDGESAVDYWARIMALPRAKPGPPLLTPERMTPKQRDQYELRLRAGWDCWDALEAVRDM